MTVGARGVWTAVVTAFLLFRRHELDIAPNSFIAMIAIAAVNTFVAFKSLHNALGSEGSSFTVWVKSIFAWYVFLVCLFAIV